MSRTQRLALALLVAPLLAPSPACAKGRLVHDYQFKRNLNDSRRGESLVSLGGTVGKKIYTFGPGQGLRLDTPGVQGDYAIEITFRLDAVDGYRKLIDFKNRASDNGLYVLDGQLNFYDFATAGAITAGRIVKVRLERNSVSGLVRGFIGTGRVPVFEFTDTGGDAVLDAGPAFFFVDDAEVTGEEASGAVTRIRIWDRPQSR